MRVIHLSTYDEVGGAARATSRLHTALLANGVDSRLLVRHSRGLLPAVAQPQAARDWPSRARRWLRRRRDARQAAEIARARPSDADGFHGDGGPWGADLLPSLLEADLVHVHWTHDYLNLPELLPVLASARPVVWTLHDLHGLTGGCHYPRGCEGWRQGCPTCPQLTRSPSSKLAAKLAQRLTNVVHALPVGRLHLVTASRWMKSLVAANPRFVDRPVTCIPFGLDTEVFSPRPRDFARETLGLPRHDKIVLFIADSTENPRKGLDVLQAAVGRLIPSSGLLLASIGQGAPPPLLPNVRQHHFGATANDRWLSLIYSAADIVVVPSREEAFGQTTLEALACGTPVVGSDTGGIPDLVIPGHTGALFPVGDSVALAARLEELLARPAALERMGANGRAQVVAKNSLAACAGSHRALYESLLP